MLLVGHEPASLQALAARVQAVLPKARIDCLASTTELVFALARQGISIVIIDSDHCDELPPSLLNLPRSASSTLRLVFVGAHDSCAQAQAHAHPHAHPQALAVHALADWLRSAGTRVPPTDSPVKAAAAAFTVQPHAADAALGDL